MSLLRRIKFRPLEQELTQDQNSHQAGFHDLISAVVHLDSSSSAMTSRHEALHDELITHTTYGGFQGNVALVASNLPPSDEYHDLFRTWMRISIESSRTAHETYATYLSIKSFAQQEGLSLLKRHPDEYQRYYNSLSSVVDPVFGSTFTQYIVGKALVSCAFWSNIRVRVVTKAAISDPNILPEESPDLRLDELLQAFPSILCGPVLQAVDETTAELEKGRIVPRSFNPNSSSGDSILNTFLYESRDNL